MDRIKPDYRRLVRELLREPFGSGGEAIKGAIVAVRAEIDADLVYCAGLLDGELELVAFDDRLDSGLHAGHRWPLNESSSLWAAAEAGSFCSDLSATPPADLTISERLPGLRSCVATAIRDSSGAAVGVVCAVDRRPSLFGDADAALLEAAASILARERELQQLRALAAARTTELTAAERRYRSLVDDLGDIVVEIDAKGQITYVNQAWTDLTGLALADMAGRDMMASVHPEDSELASAHVAEALSGAETGSVSAARTVRFLASDGSVRWMSVRGRVVFAEDGEFDGLLGILHDVTDSVLAEQQVRQALAQAEAARDEAESASSAKSEFLSRMSHELRTPLNAILGFAQLLELGELQQEDGENVEQILRAGRHLLDLINEVLDVARVESGTLSLSIEPVDLSEITAESLDLVRPAASARGITLRTPYRRDGRSVLADRQRLKQILVNLLSNAVKYNRSGGEVIVSWGSPASDNCTSGAATDHGWLRITVQDTGQGIPADRLTDVFTPFERLGAEWTDVEGSGVGLSLTKTLVQALGGSIGVSSALGAGSAFWVDLPAAKTVADPGSGADPAAGTATELIRTVLYVEDNPSNITLVRRVLARRPHVRLEVVQEGTEALEVARRLLPDLVLLDLHLPGMSGDNILAALRDSDDARLRKMPVVVVTADLSTGTQRRILDAGATLFLPKPIDVPGLLDIVDEHLPLS